MLSTKVPRISLTSSVSLLCLAYLIATFIRAPRLFIAPRFWAEDGIIYFLQARTLPIWEALWATPLNYLSLPANLSGILAVQLPLFYAPYAALGVALLVQLTFFQVAISQYKNHLTASRWLALLLIPLIVIQSFETWLNPINSQFWLALSAAMILCAPTQRYTAVTQAGNVIILVLAGLSGAVAAFLAPLFILRGLLEKRIPLMLYAFPVSLGAVIILLSAAGQTRSLSFPIDIIAVKSFLQLLMNNFCLPCGIIISGQPILQTSGFAIFCFLTLTIIYSTLFFITKKPGKWLLLASLSLLLLSSAGALNKENWPTDISLHSARYFFAPASLLFTALLFVDNKKYSKIIRGMLIWLGLHGVLCAIFFLNVAGYHDGQPWRDSVTNYLQGKSQLIYFSEPTCGFSPKYASSNPTKIVEQSDKQIVIHSPELSSLNHPKIYILRHTQKQLLEHFDQGWQHSGLYLLGTQQYGHCYGGGSPTPTTGIKIIAEQFVIEGELRQAIQGEHLMLGVGENFMDMLANRRYVSIFP